MTKEKMCQSKNWCFTDYQLLDWKNIFENDDKIAYVCWEKELCPTTQRPHNQGFVQMKKKTRSTAMQKIAKQTWIKCNGTELQNVKYCSKDNGLEKYGEYTIQGQRTDLITIYEDIKEGMPLEDIMETSFEIYCRYRNGVKDAIEFHDKRRCPNWRQVEVIVFAGITDSGKTRRAMMEATYKIQGNKLKWWDGYENDDIICIDEYDSQIPITDLLELTDGYKIRLPIKGSHTWAKWTKIFITSNVPLDKWHINAKQAHREAMLRRITSYHWFDQTFEMCQSVPKCSKGNISLCAYVGMNGIRPFGNNQKIIYTCAWVAENP